MGNNRQVLDNKIYDSLENVNGLTYNEKHIKFRQILAAFLGFIHYTSAGMIGMFPIHLIHQLRRDNILDISMEQTTWITSITILPMAPICLSSGYAMQKLPKRYILMISFILEAVASVMQYFYSDTSITILIIGRLIIGVAMAFASPIIPLYLAEVTHPKSRGFCISGVYLGLSVGFLLGNVVGSSFSWRAFMIVSLLMTFTSLLLVIYLKETYVWYLKKNDLFNVRRSFYWYRGSSEESKLEVSNIIKNQSIDTDTDTEKLPKSSFLSDFKANIKLLALPLFITITLMTTMHLSGFKVITIYSINIMGSIIPSLNVYMVTIIMDIFRIVSNIVGCILIKRYPVRLLLMVSGFGTAFSHASFCLFKYFSYLSEDVLPILSLFALAMFIILSSVGLASLPWVVCGEIFPLKVKSMGCGISLFAYYMVFFLSVKYSPLLEANFGVIGEFAFFGCCTISGTTIMFFLMPETKNKTLGDIENSIKTNTNKV